MSSTTGFREEILGVGTLPVEFETGGSMVGVEGMMTRGGFVRWVALWPPKAL